MKNMKNAKKNAMKNMKKNSFHILIRVEANSSGSMGIITGCFV